MRAPGARRRATEAPRRFWGYPFGAILQETNTGFVKRESKRGLGVLIAAGTINDEFSVLVRPLEVVTALIGVTILEVKHVLRALRVEVGLQIREHPSGSSRPPPTGPFPPRAWP